MTVLLECINIKKEFGDKLILDNINLKVKSGEKLGIVGTNGTGKTTLANIIYGQEEYYGNIIWYKDDVKIGYMKQSNDYISGFNNLSGGEKTKKILKEILCKDYDLLILDEPTNHLDYLGVNKLIEYVNNYKGTMIIISHDRYFLDRCVNNIVEIENKKLNKYNGNYTYYRDKKKKDYEDTLHRYEEQEKVKKKINAQISELRGWSDKAHREARSKAIETGNKFGGKEYNRAKAKKMDNQIKSRIKRLEKIKIEGINKPKKEESVFFDIEKAKKIGRVVVRASNISKSFNNKVVFNSSSFYILQNEKIGLFGINGCGKTTLIKAFLKMETVKGDLYFASNKKVGYISQDVIDLNEESTIINLFNINTSEELSSIITKLNLLGFKKEYLDHKVKTLSLGERMKLKILLMIKEKYDVLILDEPTNHVDLHVREQLEEVLLSFNGTIILVTHDRYMLEKVCNKLLIFKDNNIFRYEGGLTDYLNKDDINKNNDNNKIVMENRISFLIGKLSELSRNSEEYKQYDDEYNKLIKKLKE